MPAVVPLIAAAATVASAVIANSGSKGAGQSQHKATPFAGRQPAQQAGPASKVHGVRTQIGAGPVTDQTAIMPQSLSMPGRAPAGAPVTHMGQMGVGAPVGPGQMPDPSRIPGRR